MARTEQAECVIVGGGVYGCAIAFEMGARGRKVLLLEAETLASGASGGIGKRGVRANGRDLRELPAMQRAYSMWPDLAMRLEGDTGYDRIGQLTLYEREHDTGNAEVRSDVQSAFGIPTDHLSGEDLRRLEPGLSERVLGATHCPLDGVADHGSTTQAYAEAARRLGARVMEGARVEHLGARDGRVESLTLTDGSTVGVDGEVVLASNGGVSDLLGAFAPALPCWTVLPQVVMSTPLPAPPFHTLIGHFHRPLALKMIANQVMMSGGWRGRWNDARGGGETTPESVRGNVAQAEAVFPSLKGLEVDSSFADRRETCCVDGVPIIDRAPGAANLFFMTGWTGHGFALAPALAEAVADWCVGHNRPPLLEPFRLDRFSDLDFPAGPNQGHDGNQGGPREDRP